jgi:D-alanyl-D-alanine carboxypeptidase/D-alanyl-D-alanine-endopeptidase (penicillin-binding protein 4)
MSWSFGFLILAGGILADLPDARADLRNRTLDLPEAAPRPALETLRDEPAYSWSAYFAKHPELARLKLGARFGGVEPLVKNGAVLMLPASTEKLFTAAIALEVLGPEYRFENRFEGRFDPTTGTLSDVVFRVSGDPTWSNGSYVLPLQETEGAPALVEKVDEPRFNALIERLIARGVRILRGPVRVESLRPDLDRIPRPSGWKDSWKLECMAMMQTSFQSNGNCGTIAVTAGRATWVTDGVDVPLRVRVARSRVGRNAVTVAPEFDSTGRIRAYSLSGYMGRGTLYYDLPVHSSGGWLERLFVTSLARRGVRVAPRSVPGVADSLDELKEDLSSEPLLNILTVAVQRSVNGIMDRVYHEIAFATGRPADGLFLERVRSSLSDPATAEGLSFADGSGLDLRDRMRADALFEFLRGMRDRPVFRDFYSTLAVAGVSGTLRTRPVLISSPLTRGRIHAKTGTLTGINNLAGYFERESGGVEPFVVFTESAIDATSARATLDGLVVNFAAQNSR